MSARSPGASIPPSPSDIRPFAEIARGPLATVYKAVDTRTRDVVLLKQLRGHDPERRRRFAEEAHLAAAVEHPNVVRVLGAWDGSLVAEWIEGADLGRVLDETGALPPEIAAFVAREAARGLAAIHATGILHRDVSAANLLLGADGVVKMADFGLASLTDSPDGEVRGTIGTLAPEVVRGEAPTARADLFSLGAVLAHALSGRPAFAGADRSATLDAVLHDDAAAALATDPRIPPELVEVATRLLAKDPSARPASAREAADRLTEALARLGVVTAETLAAFLDDPAGYRPPEPPPEAATGPVAAAPTRGRRLLRMAALVLGVALIGGVVAFALRSPPPASAPLRAADEPPPAPSVAITESPDPPDPAEPAAEAVSPGSTETPVPLSSDRPDAPPARPPETADPSPRRADAVPAEPTTPATPVPASPGRLALSVAPWARVSVDGRDLGTTPLEAVSLPPGEHLLTLSNPDFPPHSVRVQVEAGRESRQAISLWDTVGRIQIEVSPWARVSVDGEMWDTIPPQARPLILAPGDHRLGFEHPTLGTREVRLRVAAGEQRTVRVRMDQPD